ncbi:hypothetical protein [Mesorhizobium sp.]|uniref:hypothetical protein n=1 Tax=Mesorhizobium sp. TaxID=1871066 RepID=UPI0025EFDB29|nr:hypothetical protein [Mesorhizobium sp.]
MSQPSALPNNGLSRRKFMAGTVAAAPLPTSRAEAATPGAAEPKPRQPIVTSLRINKQAYFAMTSLHALHLIAYRGHCLVGEIMKS